jgi:hypothetical protein
MPPQSKSSAKEFKRGFFGKFSINWQTSYLAEIEFAKDGSALKRPACKPQG